MNKFINQFTIITGAASGIGYALAEKALQLSMRVFLLDIDEAKLKKTVLEFSQRYQKTIDSAVLDVTKREQVFNTAKNILAKHGAPDLLINNAGSGGPIGPIWEVDFSAIQQCISLNLESLIHMTQAFLPAMIERNTKAYIVNNSSLAGFYSAPLLSAYEMAKHAAVAFTEALHHDLKNRNLPIQIALLAPGWVNTGIIQNANVDTENLTESEWKWMLQFAKRVRRGCSPAEVANIVFQGLSENCFYIFTDELLAKQIIQTRNQALLNQTAPPAFDLEK